MSEVELKLERSKEAPRISRAQLSEIRHELEPRYDDVALVISELVSNSVRHSGNGSVSVTVKTTGDRIRLEVTDNGPCFDQDHPRHDGMGLNIVDKVADKWGVNLDGACTVWVELMLEQTESQRAPSKSSS